MTGANFPASASSLRKRICSTVSLPGPATTILLPGFDPAVRTCHSPEAINKSRPPGFNASLHSSKVRSEQHTSELQSLMRISYAVFCLKKKKTEKDIQCPVMPPMNRISHSLYTAL